MKITKEQQKYEKPVFKLYGDVKEITKGAIVGSGNDNIAYWE